MSQIASFYLINESDESGLIAAAEAQSKALNTKRFGIFRPKLPLNPDPFWNFLRDHATELEAFPYSGALVLDLELLAPNTLASDDPLGERIFGITQMPFVSFRPKNVKTTTEILSAADFSNSAIEKFLKEEGRTEDFPGIVEPIRDAVARFHWWLDSVAEGQIGLLNIG